MDDIHTIYYNNFGIAFQWKRNLGKNIHKVQLVFRDTGLFLSKEELVLFNKQIRSTLLGSKKCNNCTSKNTCRSTLLETPISQVSFAVSKNDLLELENLVEGTIFQLGYNNLMKLNNISSN